MLTRRQVIAGSVGVAVAAAIPSAWARHARGAAATASGASPLGINLGGIGYASSELPFLNIMKSGGAEQGTGIGLQYNWITANSSTYDTGEESYLQVDSDGYPTSLTASPTPEGGQQFTFVRALLNYDIVTPPGVTYPYGYAGMVYRLQATGNGTITISGDATATLTISDGGTHSVTFTVATPNQGLILEITAVGSTSYPTNISVVENAYAASYDDGAIFHPTFLNLMANFKCFRFMDWQDVNNQDYVVLFTAAPAEGATSGTLTSPFYAPSGTYTVLFSDGETRAATFTQRATTCTWSGGLTNAVNGTAFTFMNAWANRTLMSNAFWGNASAVGIPIEVCLALCNQIGADCWLCVPVNYSDDDVTSLETLVSSTLNSGLYHYVEHGNEVWNTSFHAWSISSYNGYGAYAADLGSQNDYALNWHGQRTAQIATICQTVWGANFGQCIPLLGAAASDTATATEPLTTSFWSDGPASNYPIKAIAIAPYFPGNQPSTDDAATMVAQSDGGLDYLFQCMTTNVVTGGSDPGTLSSVPSDGWLGQAEAWIGDYVALIPSYSGMKLLAYEGGQQFEGNNPDTDGWQTLIDAANRDARMGTTYTAYLASWASQVGSGRSNINNLYNDIGSVSTYAWGALESAQQSVSPLSDAPPKWQAVQNYIAGS